MTVWQIRHFKGTDYILKVQTTYVRIINEFWESMNLGVLPALSSPFSDRYHTVDYHHYTQLCLGVPLLTDAM